jgi:ATP-dependent DNA ligase
VPCNSVVTVAEGIIGPGRALFEEAVAAGHEGVVAKRLSARYWPGKRSNAWKKIKQVIDLPCVVIGYRTQAGQVRDLLMATMRDGKPCYVGAVELGIPGGRAFLQLLESKRRPKPAVSCSERARWIAPELFCIVRCHGWRPSGGWRDPVFVRWEQ